MSTLYVKVTVLEGYDKNSLVKFYTLQYAFPVFAQAAAVFPPGITFAIGAQDPNASPYALFPDIASAISYVNVNNLPQNIADINTFLNTTFYTDYDVEQIDSPVLAALNAIPGAAPRSFANPTRTLNSAFQISSARDSAVSYGVDISAALSLTGGATGTVTLQYADNSGFTTNVKTVNAGSSGNTGTLTVGLGLTQTTTVTVSGIIPAGKYVKLLTANTTGTPTFAFRSAQEVLI